MLKTLIYSLLFTCLFQTVATAQTIEKGWRRIYIKDVGYFDLPITLEVENAKVKEFSNNGKVVKGYETNSFAAKEKNSNSNKSLNKTYAKISLETSISSEGDYRKLNSNKRITQLELDDLNKLCRKAISNNSEVYGNVTEWFPLKIETVNGISCMHYSFKRHFGSKPTEIVHRYSFHNNDRMHDLELSYGISEIKWKNDFSKVLGGFTITNIR